MTTAAALFAGTPFKPMVAVYTFGICHCSVCAPKDMQRSEVEWQTDIAHPTGLDYGWKIDDGPFKGGEPNPCECNWDKNRLHYLMTC